MKIGHRYAYSFLLYFYVFTHCFNTYSEELSWEPNYCPIPHFLCLLFPWENVNASESNESRPSSIHLRPHQSISSCVSTIKRASAFKRWASRKVFVQGALDAICPCHWHSRSETQKERGIKSPRRTIVGVSKGGGWGRLRGQWAIYRGAFFRWTASSDWLFMGKHTASTSTVPPLVPLRARPCLLLLLSRCGPVTQFYHWFPSEWSIGNTQERSRSVASGLQLMKPMHISTNAGLSR